MVFQYTVVLALVAIASAGVIAPHGGTSVSSRKQDDHGNYAFNYQIVDHVGATNGRAEAGNKHGVVGSYNIGDIDGRHRRVDYVADGHGFRAKVKTNEPGTALSAPAAVAINSPYTGTVAVGHAPAVIAKPVAHVAPLAVAPAAIAPVGIAAPYGYAGHGAGAYGGYGLGAYGGYGVAPALGAYGGYGHGHGHGHYY